MGTRGRGLAGRVDGVRRVIGAHSGDDRRPIPYFRHDCFQYRQFLGVRRGGRLPRGSGYDETVAS